MGSYGIGPARIVAAAIEQGADERGIVWPRALAPWQVHLVSLAKAGEAEREAADRLYEELRDAGAEVLYDDRDAGPGEKLTDAELLGCPLRVVVGRRGLAEGVVEATERAAGAEHELPVEEAAARAAGAPRRASMAEQRRPLRPRPRAPPLRARPQRPAAAPDPQRASRSTPGRSPTWSATCAWRRCPLFLYLAFESERRPPSPPRRSSSG